jgi:valyl-tRNA synthetase
MLLARVRELHCPATTAPPAASAKAVVAGAEIFMPLTGVIDFKEEERRLNREMDKIARELAQAQRKLANEDFLAKAPDEVVQKEQERLQSWTEKLTKLKAHQDRIKELMS